MLADKKFRNNTNENHYCAYTAVDNIAIEWAALFDQGQSVCPFFQYQALSDVDADPTILETVSSVGRKNLEALATMTTEFKSFRTIEAKGGGWDVLTPALVAVTAAERLAAELGIDTKVVLEELKAEVFK